MKWAPVAANCQQSDCRRYLVARYYVMGEPVYQLISAGQVLHIARGANGGSECKAEARKHNDQGRKRK